MNSFLLLVSVFLANLVTVNNSNFDFVEHPTGDLIVNVDNIQQEKGTVFVGLFNSKRTFRKIKKVYNFEKVNPTAESVEVVIKDVPFDDYAIVIFQDYNENKKFDKNFMGIPKEPFGFSTNFVVTRRAPKYNQVTFEHQKDSTELNIRLQVF